MGRGALLVCACFAIGCGIDASGAANVSEPPAGTSKPPPTKTGVPGTENGLLHTKDASVRNVDAGICGTESIDAAVETVIVPGNVLIVFDQSESMKIEDLDGEPRWKAAGDALVQAILPNQDALNVGAIFFPTKAFTGGGIPLMGCEPSSVAAIDDTSVTPPQIQFMPAPQFLTEWQRHWTGNPLTVGTPTEVGLQRAKEALEAAKLPGATAVVLVTDGTPTCGSIQNAVDVATALKNEGVPLYVIGLPGASSGDFTLGKIVDAAGTGPYLSVTDGATLQQIFASISTRIIQQRVDACTVKLSKVPPDLERVTLIVTIATTGEQYAVREGPDTWELHVSEATLLGSLCQDAMGGRFSRISFEMGCVTKPYLR